MNKTGSPISILSELIISSSFKFLLPLTQTSFKTKPEMTDKLLEKSKKLLKNISFLKKLKDNKKTMTKIIQNLIINFKLWPHQLSWLSSRRKTILYSELFWEPTNELLVLEEY